MPSVTAVVEDLLRASGSGESVEDLYRLRGIAHRDGEQRADWLLRGRSVIVEFKELVDDQFVSKVAAVLHPYAMEIGRPHGVIDVDDVIRVHPKGQELNRKLDEAITRILRAGIERANAQIRDTKRILKLNSALGLVVVFNTANAVLSQRHIGLAMDRQLLRSRDRLESVNAVAVLTPYLEVHAPGARGRMPFLVFPYPTQAGERAASAAHDIADQLNARFAPEAESVRLPPGHLGQLPLRDRFPPPVLAPKGIDPAEIMSALAAAKGPPRMGPPPSP